MGSVSASRQVFAKGDGETGANCVAELDSLSIPESESLEEA